MRYPAQDIVERVRMAYPKGCRVVLTHMNDRHAPPIGTKGTVLHVDDVASIIVVWDNGLRLNVVYGEDRCRKIEE